LRRTARRAERDSTGERLALALRYLGVGVLLVSLFLSAAIYLQFRHDRNLTVAREAIRLGSVNNVLARYLESVALDLTQLAEEPAVAAYLATGSERDRQHAILQLLSFAKYKMRYAQVRIIAANGWERIRIDHDESGVRVIPDAYLQDKRNRYYFHDAIDLSPGLLYVSPLDLNIEHGEIELPYRPMIRFALPLRNAAGTVKAVLVLNFNAQTLLNRFDQAVAAARGRVELLNSQGYWLRSPDHSREWGFMFPHGPRFADLHASTWAKLSRLDHGVVSNGSSLLVFTTVYPLSGMEDNGASGVPRLAERQVLEWKIVSELSDNLLLADIWEQHGWVYGTVWLVLLLASGVASWVLAGIRLERHEIHQERLLHARVFDAGADAMMITDRNGRILSVNAAFTRQNGYAGDEIVGQYPSLLHAQCENDTIYEQMWQALHAEDYWQGQLWYRRKDGTEYPVWLRISAIRDDEGQVIAYVGLTSDITAHHQAEAELRHQAHHDELTGLVSRRLFRDRLARALARAQRSDEGGALCYLDLDGFKPINDRYGHEAGDQVLRALAQRMTENLRDVDTLARVGGDEFAVILTGQQTPDTLGPVIERMQHALREPIHWQGHVLHLDSSVGIACFPQDATEAEELLRKADVAMYAAKQAGGGNWMCYEDAPPQVPSSRPAQ
jgi:diguanylate cyclase (GGDEF)-like protein/PAS domain S-box-containing protein